MATEYRLDVKNTAGVLQASFDDFVNTLTYSKPVNKVGLLQFALPADHGAIAYLTDKAQVEVWRRDRGHGVAWHADYYGLVRTTQYGYDANGLETFTVYCPSILSMLGWRVVAWAADTANRSAFTTVAAETIMKTLVSYNAGASATVANGRKREGAITGLSVQADGAAGTALDWNCAWANLLSTLQELALVGGGDFDLVSTGAATWEFRWYTGQLGTDRSATVTFATERGNMASPTLTDARADEKTVAIVGGQGEGSLRSTAVRTGANYNASTNNIEVFRDARDRTTAAGLEDAGDTLLDQLEARRALSFTVIETPACVYNRDFFAGDKVTAKYRDFSETVQITDVTVSVDNQGKETKTFELTVV